MDDIIPLSLTKTTLWLLALSASHFGGLEAPGSGPGRPAPAWRLAELQEHRHRCSPPPAWPRTRPQKLRAGPKTALKLPSASQSLQSLNPTLLHPDFPFPSFCVFADELTSRNLMLDSDSGVALVPAKSRSHRGPNACYSESLEREVRCLEDKILKGAEFG